MGIRETPRAAFDVNDFHAYFLRSIVTYKGVPSLVERVTDGGQVTLLMYFPGTSKRVNVPLADLQSWENLSTPRLGWRNLSPGVVNRAEVVHLSPRIFGRAQVRKGLPLELLSTRYPPLYRALLRVNNNDPKIPRCRDNDEGGGVQEIMNGRDGQLIRDIFYPEFPTIKDAINTLNSGDKLAVAVNPSVCLSAGTDGRHIDVLMNTTVVGAVSPQGVVEVIKAIDLNALGEVFPYKAAAAVAEKEKAIVAMPVVPEPQVDPEPDTPLARAPRQMQEQHQAFLQAQQARFGDPVIDPGFNPFRQNNPPNADDIRRVARELKTVRFQWGQGPAQE